MTPKRIYQLSVIICLLWDILLLMALLLVVPVYFTVTLVTFGCYLILFLYCYHKGYQLGQLLAFLSVIWHVIYFIYLFSFMFAL